MKLSFEDIEMAFDYVNMSPPLVHRVLVDRETSETYYQSKEDGLMEFPDNADHERYVEIPRKSELRLGKSLVLEYVTAHLPKDLDEVRRIFSRERAYSHFRGLLNKRGKIDEWQAYEGERIEFALREWCRAKGLALAD